MMISANFNDIEYFYIRNAQGDIIGLIDENGVQVVSYTYDAWGKLLNITGSHKDTIGLKNPYRYKGYRYDNETGLYYLQSRYYNPEWGRFINADTVLGQPGQLLTHNIFSYCDNNPISREDSDGHWWVLASAVIGIGISVVTQIIANKGNGDDWNKNLLGAAVGGAISGAMAGLGVGVISSSFVGGLVTSAINEVEDSKAEKRKYSWGRVTINTAFNTAGGYVGGKIGSSRIPLKKSWTTPPKTFKGIIKGVYSKKSLNQNLYGGIMNLPASIIANEAQNNWNGEMWYNRLTSR